MRCYLFTSSCAIAVILAVTFLGHSALVVANELSNTAVEVGVYYESLCPDSIRWIKQQLMPHYDVLKNYINVTFVPYGKASHWQDTDTQQWHFTCQHGPEECNGNKAQACGIYAIQNEEPANKVQQLSVALVGCVMSSRFPPSSVPQCAQNVGLSEKTQTSTLKCIEGPKSNELLVSHGMTTQNLKPNLSFVPTITINGVNSQEIQSKAQSNFFKLICDTLAEGTKPSQCSTA